MMYKIVRVLIYNIDRERITISFSNRFWMPQKSPKKEACCFHLQQASHLLPLNLLL